ncbi:MAG: peptidase P60, partial [Pseudomonadota bacterium]
AIHASGHAMQVVREPIRDAIERIAHLYDRPTCVRRP